MTAHLRVTILALLIGLGGAPRVIAQTADRDAAFSATTLLLAADGEAKAVPDMATLTLGADATAPSAREAMAANAQAMAAVLSALRRAGVAERDIQTSALGLEPQYVYEQGKPPRLIGYQASNRLTVTVRDLAALGSIIDAGAGAGATNVGGVSFGFANPASAQNSARLAAVKALDDKASLYAQAVGYHIVRLVSLSEGAGEDPGLAVPRVQIRMAAKAAQPTPVEAGETTVRIAFTGVFELGR